jgi:hypothetical protein
MTRDEQRRAITRIKQEVLALAESDLAPVIRQAQAAKIIGQLTELERSLDESE